MTSLTQLYKRGLAQGLCALDLFDVTKEDVTNNHENNVVEQRAPAENSDSDEPLIIKTKKASECSGRSIRRQKAKADLKARLLRLKNQSLAATFILGESAVTYRPPSGYYGSFGVKESRVQAKTLPSRHYEAESSSDREVLSVKKPHTHFISNEIVEVTSEDLDISDNTLENNLNKDIDTVNEEDIGNVDSMLDSTNSDPESKEGKHYENKRDESGESKRYGSPVQHIFSNVGRRYACEKIYISSSTDECEKHHVDPDWRRKLGTFKMSNKGDGSHRLIIESMKEGDDDRDRKLMSPHLA